MRRTVDKLPIQPVFNPCGELIVIIYYAFPLFKQRVIHFAFGSGYKCHYAILMIAEVSVAAGNCTVKVVVDVLFEPKSNTHTAPSAPAL